LLNLLLLYLYFIFFTSQALRSFSLKKSSRRDISMMIHRVLISSPDSIHPYRTFQLPILFMTLDSKLNQAIDQFRIWYTACFPQLRIHADFSKTWKRVDIINNNVPILQQEKVIPCESLALQCFKCFNRCFLNLFNNITRQICRNR